HSVFFFPCLCKVVLSGSKPLLFGGASDEEQGSKEGDYRGGKFHRIAFVGFCCEPGKKSNILILASFERCSPLEARFGFALPKVRVH
ncbi:MAG TPA: hypothetical protein VFW91_04075, partial [Candidatus Binatia bacterium]|nr:hypothetical protein [Candidatus Binatia bacterium]